MGRFELLDWPQARPILDCGYAPNDHALAPIASVGSPATRTAVRGLGETKLGSLMSTRPEPSRDGRSVTVHVPLAFKRRGGRKQVVTPGGSEDGSEAGWAPRPVRADSTLVKALAR